MPHVEVERKRKILFVVSTASQATMFGSLGKELADWEILAVDINRNRRKRAEIGRLLEGLNFPYGAVDCPSPGKASRVIHQAQPDIVVVGHDTDLDTRFFIKAANSRYIPTLLVQDGIWAPARKQSQVSNLRQQTGDLLSLSGGLVGLMKDEDRTWRQKLQMVWTVLRYSAMRKQKIYGHGECTKMAVFSEAVKELRVLEGVDSERIVVTGSPKFDEVFYYSRLDCKSRVCQRWGISPQDEIITLLTGPFVKYGGWGIEQERRFVLAVARAVMALPNAKLIIKVHPAEFEAEYHEIVKELESPPIICKNIILPELVSASSLVMTVASSAAIEAMAAGKPVIIVNLFDDSEPLFYKGSGALYVDREEDILPAIKEGLYDPKIREEMRQSAEKFVYQQAYLQDGQASKRIANLVLSMTTTEGVLVESGGTT